MAFSENDLILVVVLAQLGWTVLRAMFKVCDRCGERAQGHIVIKSGCCAIDVGDTPPSTPVDVAVARRLPSMQLEDLELGIAKPEIKES